MKKSDFGKVPALGYLSAPLTRLITVILVIGCLCPIPAIAEIASNDDMDRVCQNWLTYSVAQIGAWAGTTDPGIIGAEDIVENDTLLARYYEIYPDGFVVVPVLKSLPPVKAYCDNSRLDLHEADGFAVMLREVLQNRIRVFVDFYGSLEAVPGVTRTQSFIDSLRTLNRAFHEDSPAAERIPDSRAAVSELLFMIPKPDLQRFAIVAFPVANVTGYGDIG